MTSSANSNVGGNENGDENPKRYSNCVACVISVILAAILMFKIKMLLDPSDNPPPALPNFSVSSFTATFINATSSYQIALNFTVRKPESDSTKAMAYNDILASMYYGNKIIGTATLFPFNQEEIDRVAVVKAKFVVDPKIDFGVVGVFNISVSVITASNDNQYVIGTKLDVFCEDIWVESGSMVAPMKDCRVEESEDQ